MGCSTNGGTQKRWMVNLSMGKSIYKWMRTGGTPMDWKPPCRYPVLIGSIAGAQRCSVRRPPAPATRRWDMAG